MKFIRTVLASLTILITSVTASVAGEWRPGDEAWVRVAGVSEQVTVDIAEAYQNEGVAAGNELFEIGVANGTVLVAPYPVPVTLVVKIAGPYHLAGEASASVWAIEVGEGMILYVLLDDTTGPHEPTQSL